MKLSKYVKKINGKKNKMILYNMKTGFILTANSDLNFSKKDKDKLIKLEYLVPKNLDEFQEFKNNAIKFSKTKEGGLFIHIYLTLFCNMDCPYCFEKKDEKYRCISEEVKTKILKFIEFKLKSNPKFVQISWFGGEPLLEFETMKEMNEKIQKITNEYNISYFSQLITNGFLLEKITDEYIHDFSLKNIIVSLDGLEKTHNKRRPHIEGKNSFQKTYDNIKKMTQINSKINIIINFVVDKSNVDSIIKLLTQLKQENFFSKCSFMVNFVTCNDGVIKEKNIKEVALKLYKHIINENLEEKMENFLPNQFPLNCCAQLANYYHIKTDGKVFKCTFDVTKEDKNPLFDLLNEDFYSNKDFYNDSVGKYFNECEKCEYLPICHGGCPRENTNKKLNCSHWKYILEDIILLKLKKGDWL